MKKRDIESLENIVSLGRSSKDYSMDLAAARDMARNIQDYWHKRGYTWVKIWLEPHETPSGQKRWDIRGNIAFAPPK